MNGKTYDCIGRLFEDIIDVVLNNIEACQVHVTYTYDDYKFNFMIGEQKYEACRAEFNVDDNYISKNGNIINQDEALELLNKLKTIKETTITIIEKVVADYMPKYKITEVCEAIFRSGINNILMVASYLSIETKSGEERKILLNTQLPYFAPEKYTEEKIKTKIENLLIFT